MKINKKVSVIIASAIFIILVLSNTVKATYQCNSTGTNITNKPGTWIVNIRKMEAEGNIMGFAEEIGTDGIATTNSNNMDVHMLKNTEYGAILLLGASNYGKQGADITARRMDQGATTGNEVQASSTGNKYGVYQLGGSYEWVAAGGTSFITTIAPRYINRYTSTSERKAGDATLETKGWHSSATYGFASGSNGFVRGYSGAFGYRINSTSDTGYARPAVVIGQGF